MRLRRCIAIVALAAVVCGCKRPSTEAWAGQIAAIDALNGMTATFVLEDGSRLSGMRAGARLPPGTRIDTQPGVLVKLEMDDGSEIALEGGAQLQLDRYQPRSANLLRGRAVLTAPPKPARLDVESRAIEFTGQIAVEVSPALSTIAVLRGQASSEATEAGVAQVLELNDRVALRPAFDIADRAWFEPRRQSRSEGYGHVDDDVVLVDHLVHAELDHHFATTTITESFRNPTSRDIDLHYRYTLPDDAVLTEVAVKDDDGKWMTSTVEKRDMAAKTYADARSKGRAAVLMSAEGDDVVVRVANVHAQAQRRVRVTYVQPLRPTVGGLRYAYEMPRDAAGEHVAQRFRIEVTTAHVPERVAVYGYGVEVGPTPGGAVAEFEAADFSPTGDLAVVVPSPDFVATRYARGMEQFVVVTVRPEIGVSTHRDADLLIVVDTSGSRRAHEAKITRLLQALAERLPTGHRAMFATCATRCTAAADTFGPEPAVPALSFGGTTNITEVGRFAARVFEKHGGQRARHVIYVSDGVASAGDVGLSNLAASLDRAGARLQLVDFGPITEAHLAAANAAQSDAIMVDPTRPFTAMLRILASAGSTPLTDMGVTLDAESRQGHEGPRPPVLPGGALTAIARGRATGVAGDIQLRGQLVGETWQVTKKQIKFGDGSGAAAPAIWASRRVQRLEAATEEQAHVAARELALEFGLVSRDTSLVAVGQRGLPRSGAGGISERGIGLANIGTAGRNGALGGFGRGAGDLGERRARVVKVVPGRPAVQGSLDKEIIRRVVRQHRRELKYCYEGAARHHSGLEGRVEFRFTISPTGSVVSAVVKATTLHDQNAENCMAAKVRRWVFPEPKGSGIVIVHYPFNFSGAGDAGQRPQHIPTPVTSDGPSAKTIVTQDFVNVDRGSWQDPPRFASYVQLQASLGQSTFDAGLAVGTPPPPVGELERTVHAAMLGHEAQAQQMLLDAVERDPNNAALHETIAATQTDAAVSCAHRQAAASLRGESVPHCPMTSGPSSAAAPPAPPQGAVDMIATLEGAPDGRLMLVRHDGVRRWWLEPKPGTTCLGDDVETCWFDELDRGIYTLRVVSKRRSGTARVTWRFMEKEHTREVSLSDGYVVTVVPEDVVLYAPEVSVPVGPTDLGMFGSAAYFCALLGDARPERLETKAAVQPDGQVRPAVRAFPPNPTAEKCLANYVSKLGPVEQGTTYTDWVLAL